MFINSVNYIHIYLQQVHKHMHINLYVVSPSSLGEAKYDQTKYIVEIIFNSLHM